MTCEICQGRGFVDDGTGRMARCSCFDPRPGIWQRAGVPTEYRCAFETLDTFKGAPTGRAPWPSDDRPGRGESLESWRGSPPFVVIKGDFGLGKTKLGVEILDRIVLNRIVPSYRFIAAAEVPAVCFSGDPAEWKALLAEPALLLDDLGRGYQKDQAMAISRLVNHRWGWRLPTVFPTNLTVAFTCKHCESQNEPIREKDGSVRCADCGEKGDRPKVSVTDGAVLDRLQSGLVVKLEGESRRKPR